MDVKLILHASEMYKISLNKMPPPYVNDLHVRRHFRDNVFPVHVWFLGEDDRVFFTFDKIAKSPVAALDLCILI